MHYIYPLEKYYIQVMVYGCHNLDIIEFKILQIVIINDYKYYDDKYYIQNL